MTSKPNAQNAQNVPSDSNGLNNLNALDNLKSDTYFLSRQAGQEAESEEHKGNSGLAKVPKGITAECPSH